MKDKKQLYKELSDAVVANVIESYEQINERDAVLIMLPKTTDERKIQELRLHIERSYANVKVALITAQRNVLYVQFDE